MLSDVKPFQMIENIYYVGSSKYSSHLINTGDGLLMIDTGLPEHAEGIVASVEALGFSIRDLKIILHSHGHSDHIGATPYIVAQSGAMTYLAKEDMMYLPKGETVDRFLQDGDVIRLGNTSILCRHTPGHTVGTFSFFFDVPHGGAVYRAAMFGGAGTNQLRKSYLVREGRPNLSFFQREMFFRSLQWLAGEHVDITLGNHPWHNQTLERASRLASEAKNPFIDETVWQSMLERLERDLSLVIEEESKSLFINYAHRGASEYAPENTFLAFYLGLFMGANGIETDVRLTKDGVPVLFHDGTIERVTGKPGSVSDYTYRELSEIPVTKNGLGDTVPTLEDFLAHFHNKPITLAIELKEKGTAMHVAEALRKYDLTHKTVVTSFDLDELAAFRAYAPEYKTGYLTGKIDEALLLRLRALGVDELCPSASLADRDSVCRWHRMGFLVRAWGVRDPALMKQAYDAGCDGMTVNFPDKLTALMREGQCSEGAVS